MIYSKCGAEANQRHQSTIWGDPRLSATPRPSFLAAVLLASVLAMVSLPGIAAAQTWHGQIECASVPGLTTKPLSGAFAVSVNGSRLTYSRPVHKADLASLSGVTESGTGVLAGNDITLQGGAAGKG
jgi:hypothetical protein